MSVIKVDNFLGYTSKDGAEVNTPAMGSDCENIIINKGDICNIPYAKAISQIDRLETGVKLLSDYYYEDIMFLIACTSLGFIRISRGSPFSSDSQRFWSTLPDDKMLLFKNTACNIKYRDSNTNRNVPVNGNFIRVGEWLLFLSICGELDAPRLHSGFPPVPRMLRFKCETESVDYPNGRFIPMLIGIKAPATVTRLASNDGGGFVNGTWDFAFTFVTNISNQYDYNGNIIHASATGLLGKDDIESNATILNLETTYINAHPEFGITLPKGYNNLELNGFEFERVHYVGVYIKKSTQSTYSFLQYWPVIESDFSQGLLKIEIDAVLEDNQDITKTAPKTDLTPVKGAHDVPRPAIHGCFYIDRMYYAAATKPYNLLQWSQKRPLEDPNNKYFNYIEGQEGIGRGGEKITGLIEFLGQLVIFKENNVYVLTDDVELGSLRILFPGLGCVNKFGGHGYLVANNVLYWVDDYKVYSYNGIGEPKEISLLIEEDLKEIESSRFSFARLSHDVINNLIYLTFPRGHFGEYTSGMYPSFIFHPNEFLSKDIRGVWTKMNKNETLTQVLTVNPSKIDIPNRLLFNKTKRLELINDLDEQGIENIIWFWVSSILDLRNPNQLKQWEDFSANFKRLLATYRLRVTVYDKDYNILWDKILVKKDEVYRLGICSEKIKIKLSSPGTTNLPFRLNGYELQARLLGRR